MNYKEWYEWGCRRLVTGGIEEAKLDARLLLEAVCHTAQHDLLVNGDRILSENQLERYKAGIEERKNHKPLQYITGMQEFMGLSFRVGPQVLIPRQDTEILAEEALRHIHDRQSVLDMCTGSGCILLSLLSYTNDLKGTGADISEEALAVAADNAERLHLQAEWIKSDLFAAVTGRYDMIVSNPPYIPTRAIDGLMEEVREYEPGMALDGGEDGLFYYRRLTEQTGDYLYRDGMLLLEVGSDQAEAVGRLMHVAGFMQITCVKDLAGLDRVVYGTYGGNQGV